MERIIYDALLNCALYLEGRNDVFADETAPSEYENVRSLGSNHAGLQTTAPSGGRMTKWKGIAASFAPSSLIIAGAVGTFFIISNTAAAQTYTGYLTTYGPFPVGAQNFYDTSVPNASTTNAVS